jgi:hypothetical protein
LCFQAANGLLGEKSGIQADGGGFGECDGILRPLPPAFIAEETSEPGASST